MFVSSLLSLLAVTAGSLATCTPTNASTPAAPATKYLFTVNIASPKAYVLGDTPAGQRVFEPITGGNFSGPAGHGTFPILASTVDFFAPLLLLPRRGTFSILAIHKQKE